MKRILRKKSVLTMIFVTGAVILIFALFGNKNPLISCVRTVFSPVLTLTSRISYEVGSFKDYFIELSVYREENERLSDELIDLKRKNKDVSELSEENERLKGLLDLKNSLKYLTVPAVVVSYEPDNWYNTMIINKGKNDGIKVGDAVISAKGAVGKVTDTGLGWSTVSSLLNNKTAVGVRVVRSGELAVVEGDLKLSEEKLCRMSFFNKGADLYLGDIVETTGAGGIYPEKILVGTIVKLEENPDGSESAVIEPLEDFENLYEVLVVTGMVEE